jgi:voltage-gated potassium channel
MTPDDYPDLPRAKRRRILLGATLRGLLSATALVVLYYVLPLDEPFGVDAAIRVLIGLVIFIVITVWQVKAIIGSNYPGVQAVQALGLIATFYLLLFASTYFIMERASAASFTEPMTRTDALYFTVTVFSTVGFGDIAPKSEAARIVLIFQMLGDLAVLGVGIRLLLLAVQRARRQRARTDEVTDPATRRDNSP